MKEWVSPIAAAVMAMIAGAIVWVLLQAISGCEVVYLEPPQYVLVGRVLTRKFTCL